MSNLDPEGILNDLNYARGDATITLPKYLNTDSESVIAMAYFDFDVYKPTLTCLQAISPFLTKGSILAFADACHKLSRGRQLRYARQVFCNGARSSERHFADSNVMQYIPTDNIF
jgi:hypothetical protein